MTSEEGQLYSHGVAETILVSLDAVRIGGQVGIGTRILETMAVLSPAGVRPGLLHTAGQEGALARNSRKTKVSARHVNRALVQLADRSLLTITPDRETIIGRRLVIRVVRDALAKQGRYATVCHDAALVLDKYTEALMGSQDRSAVRDSVEQIRALYEGTAGAGRETDNELTRVLLRLRLRALYHLNELRDSTTEAVLLGEPLAAEFERVLGPDHPDTLAVRNNLARAYQTVGQSAKAIPLFEQSLAASQRVLGTSHPDTLAVRNNLASAYQAVGQSAKAIPLFEQTLAARERVLGRNHPDTLTSQDNLASAYQDVGQLAKAIPLFEQTLAASERVLGRNHPGTLIFRNNLAVGYQGVGQSAKAIPLFKQNLASLGRVLGPHHPDTLTARNNLAIAYQDAGRTE